MSPLLARLRQLRPYPPAVVGLAIIAALVALSVFTMVTVPYGQALELWRGAEPWRMHPVNASPVWSDWLTGADRPRTLIVSSRDATIEEERFEGGRRLRVPLAFDYRHAAFPSELNLFLSAQYDERRPFVRFVWETPDGREI